MHRDFLRHLKLVYIGNSAIKCLTVPVTLATAQLLSMVISFASAGDVAAVTKNALILLIVISAFTALHYAADVLLEKQKCKALNDCRMDFLVGLLRAPLPKLFRADYGELTENLSNDIDTLTKRYTDLYPGMIAGVLGTAGYLLFLLLQSPLIAVSLLGISLLQLIPPMLVKKYLQVNYDQCRDIEAQVTNHIIEAVDGFEAIKLYGLKGWWQAKMAALHKEYLVVGQKSTAAFNAQIAMYRLLNNILKYGTYGLVGVYVMLGYCRMGTAIAAIYLSGGLFEAVKTIFSVIPELAVSQNAEKRLDKWQPSDKFAELPAGENRALDAENLTFSYEGRQIFDRFSFHFDPDKNYLLEGSNGSGKTTLFGLLAGFLLPEGGSAAIGGLDSARFGESPDPQRLFLVPQHDPEYTFDVETFLEMFGKDKKAAMIAAAKRLGAAETVLTGQSIRSLSGGERKKIFLAAGFAMAPCWLLLDEPTNNLDAYGKETLAAMMAERKGVIAISHDPDFARAADCRIRLGNRDHGGEECDHE